MSCYGRRYATITQLCASSRDLDEKKNAKRTRAVPTLTRSLSKNVLHGKHRMNEINIQNHDQHKNHTRSTENQSRNRILFEIGRFL